jgi:uncharacterized membrane protein
MQWTRSDLIQAPVEQVWNLTIDIDGWPDILPTVNKVTRVDSGPLRPGSRAIVEQPGLRAEWTVHTVEPHQRFVWATEWRGRPLVAEHLIEAVDSATRNTLRLDLGGPRNAVLGVLLGLPMRLTLTREGRAFRRAAEGSPIPRTAVRDAARQLASSSRSPSCTRPPTSPARQ